MLRRWRSLKKIVYAASILFGTIILYATTSSNDYEQDTNRQWVLPIVARHGVLHVDADLHEPLHRLPLGPFEDHQVPVVVETLQLQIPTFNDSKSEGIEPSNSGGAAHAALSNGDAKPGVPLVPAPAAQVAPAKPPEGANPVAANPPSAGNPPAANPPAAANPPLPPPATPKPQPPAPPAPPAPPPPPPKPLPDITKVMAEMNQRLNHTRLQCAKFQVPNQVDSEVYVLPKFNISYCKVPKAGCTYWEQVIAFLNKPTHELAYLGIKSPFQISKFDIRYTSHFNLPRRDFRATEDKSEILKTTRVLFVRHPLERLWSCYLEKFFLLDFWTTAGIQMKTAGAENKCPKSITFREFIDFTLPLFNENWAPVTELCNPCTFQPHVIGHVETMRDDTFYTYKQVQQEWIFSEHDKLSREENQMLDMAIYNYQIHSIHWYSFFHKCLTQKELAAKLWEVFKKVGYLSSHAAMPDNLPDYNQTTVIRELKSQFRKFPLGPTNGRAQQLKMIRRDFESLPKPTMAKVLERYALDFQLFGYSTQIPTA